MLPTLADDLASRKSAKDGIRRLQERRQMKIWEDIAYGAHGQLNIKPPEHHGFTAKLGYWLPKRDAS